LPAPFGPISPTISPGCSDSETSLTATTPPKRRVRLRSSRIGSGIGSGCPRSSFADQAGAQHGPGFQKLAHESLRDEIDHRDDDYAEHGGMIVDEIGPDEIVQDHIDHRADQRAE